MSPPADDVGDSDEETKALVYRHLLSVSRELADQFKHEFSLDEKKGPTNVLNLEEIVEVSQLLAETMALNTLIYRHLLSSIPEMAEEFKAEFGLDQQKDPPNANMAFHLEEIVKHSPLVAASPVGKKRKTGELDLISN